MTTIVVEHRDRFARFASEYVAASLQANARRPAVVDDAEVDDDLVRDMTEVLSSFCARLYGRRAPHTERRKRWRPFRSQMMSRRYVAPEGHIIPAFTFTLDPTDEQSVQIARFFGARRKAFNWTLDQIQTDLEHYRETGESSAPPSFYSLRKRWNAEKDTVCVNDPTGEVWWPEVSKEVFADGVRGAADVYWRWQKSRAGTFTGRKIGLLIRWSSFCILAQRRLNGGIEGP